MKRLGLASILVLMAAGCADRTDHSGLAVEQTGNCTLTQGYWKNHEEAWPVASMALGTVGYTKGQLLEVLREPVRGNGLISLAHQLTAAYLNLASGADGAQVRAAIDRADAMIGDLAVPPVGNGRLSSAEVSALVGELDDFNNGRTGPGHCGQGPAPMADGGPDAPPVLPADGGTADGAIPHDAGSADAADCDATVTLPDAAMPDAGSPAPDAETPAPDAETAAPDVAPPAPDATPSAPDAPPVLPADAGTPPAHEDCPMNPCAGLQVDLLHDSQNCGACGRACSSGEACQQGACVPVCSGTMCGDTCTDLETDPSSCGGCGIHCGATEMCRDGVCCPAS